MVLYEHRLRGDADALLSAIEDSVMRSVTAKREASSDLTVGDARMVIRTYERFSATGASRVSLTISVLAHGDELAVVAVSAGGSQAVFFKMNIFGEQAFLKLARTAIDGFAARGAVS